MFDVHFFQQTFHGPSGMKTTWLIMGYIRPGGITTRAAGCAVLLFLLLFDLIKS